MLECFEKQFISGKIPESVENRFYHIRKQHDFIDFYDSEFIIAHSNNLYRFNKDKLHLATKNKEFIPVEWGIEVLNPLTQEFKDIDTEKSEFHSRNRKIEINQYTRGYQEYLKVDYEHCKYWLWFDITSYVQDKYSKEVTISFDDYSWLYLDIYESKKKIKTFKDYRDNVDVAWSDSKALGHVVGFTEAQDFYSFIRDLNSELSTVNFASKYSELYDAVASGKISKEVFLKEIVK